MDAPRPRSGLAAALGRTLPPLAWALALFYGCLAAYWAFALQPAFALLGALWVANALAFALLGAFLRAEGSASAQWFASGAVAALTTMASGALLHQTGDPSLAIATCITLLGLSLFVVSRRILGAAALAAFALAGWAAWSWPGTDWSAALFAILAAALVAFLAQAMRIRAYDRLEASHRLQQAAQAKAQEQERLRYEAETTASFLRLAAHQLGNPLTTVTLQARRLARADLPEAYRRAAQAMDRNVQRLAGIVGDMLALTQHQAGLLVLRKSDTDLSDVVAAEAAAATPAAEAKGVRIATDLERVRVQVDGGRIAQAVRTLLAHAVARAPTPGVVQLSLRATPGIRIEVLDDGPPLAPGQAGPLMSPLSEGVGSDDALALAVAKAVVEAHGGHIGQEAAPGGGAVWWLELPAEPADLDQGKRPA